MNRLDTAMEKAQIALNVARDDKTSSVTIRVRDLKILLDAIDYIFELKKDEYLYDGYTGEE